MKNRLQQGISDSWHKKSEKKIKQVFSIHISSITKKAGSNGSFIFVIMHKIMLWGSLINIMSHSILGLWGIFREHKHKKVC